MYFSTTGIVLHSIKYSDTSLVTTIYTQSHGRKSFLVQGVYRKHSKFPPTLFQPLTLLDMEISVTPKRELQRVKELSINYPFHTLHFDHSKSAIALFLSELLYKTLREEEANNAMFDYLLHSIQLLDTIEQGIANFHLWFTVHLTKLLGFYPVNNFSKQNCVFDYANGRFYEPILTYPSRDDLSFALLLHELLQISSSGLDKLLLNHETRSKLLDGIIDYYHFHLGGLGQIKSLQVLQEVFKD